MDKSSVEAYRDADNTLEKITIASPEPWDLISPRTIDAHLDDIRERLGLSPEP